MRLKKDHALVAVGALAVSTLSMALLLTVVLMQKRSGLYVERISGKRINLVYANYSNGTQGRYGNTSGLVIPPTKKLHHKRKPALNSSN